MKKRLSLIISMALAVVATAQNHVVMNITQEAPVVQKKHIFIEASAEDIWSILINIEDWGQWNDRIKQPSLKVPLEVGTVFTWKTNGSKIKSIVHTLSSCQVLGWTGQAFGANAIHNWYLEPVESGTIVRVEESMDGWIVKLLKNKMNNKLADDMQYWLEKLKSESEK